MINEIKPIVELVDNPTTAKIATEMMPKMAALVGDAVDVSKAAATKLLDEALGTTKISPNLGFTDHGMIGAAMDAPAMQAGLTSPTKIRAALDAPVMMPRDMHSVDLPAEIKTTLNDIELMKGIRIPAPPALVTSELLNEPRFDISTRGISQITFPKDFSVVDKAKSMLAAQHANMIQYDEKAFDAAAGPLKLVTDGTAPMWPIDRITTGMQQRALDGSLAFVNGQKGNSYTDYLRNSIGKYDQLSWLTKRLTD